MKKIISILLTMIMVLLMAAPAFALADCRTVWIYDFDTLKEDIELLNKNNRTEYKICNDIVFTDTIEINAQNLTIEFSNNSGKDEVNFIIGDKIGLYLKWGSKNCDLIFDGITFKGNETYYEDTDDGNGIYVGQYSEKTKISGAKFENLGVGDGLYAKASTCGGGIYINSEDITISNCKFVKCNAYCGGGIYIDNDDVTVEGCTFDTCATAYGGGVYVGRSCSDVYIKSCEFLNTKSNESNGKAVYGSGEGYTFVYKSGNNLEDGRWFKYCTVDPDYAGSFLSTGNIAIVSAVVVLAGIAMVVFIKRKKSNGV